MNSTQNENPEPDCILRLPEVMRVTGYGRSTLYDKSAKGEFPQPVKLGRKATGWLGSEVAAWIRQRPRVVLVRGDAPKAA